jgi:hypothetical protein
MPKLENEFGIVGILRSSSIRCTILIWTIQVLSYSVYDFNLGRSLAVLLGAGCTFECPECPTTFETRSTLASAKESHPRACLQVKAYESK